MDDLYYDPDPSFDQPEVEVEPGPVPRFPETIAPILALQPARELKKRPQPPPPADDDDWIFDDRPIPH
jgi:hypothetical protein